jgi:GMP synthase (glutamine-hydrolysing)
VQFHPEFDATVTRAHVGWYAGFLEERGDDVGRLQDSCVATPAAHGLLARFAAIR